MGELVHHRFVHQYAPGARAALTRGADRAEHDRGDGQLEVGLLVDDDRVVAPELQQELAHAAGDPVEAPPVGAFVLTSDHDPLVEGFRWVRRTALAYSYEGYPVGKGLAEHTLDPGQGLTVKAEPE